MNAPELPDGVYSFGPDTYPLAELAMHQPPAAISQLIISQAAVNGLEINRDEIVELVFRGGPMEGHRYVVYWPADDEFHMLVPKRSIVGRA